MIESISISDVATYLENASFSNLKAFNYLYGANGSGKTTISKIMADETSYPSCKVSWKSGSKLQAMVYNRDFVDKNFNSLSPLRGIFTLGEKNIEIIEKIESSKKELDDLSLRIEKLTLILQGSDGKGGRNKELEDLENEFKEKCWERKKKFDSVFFGSFEGYRNSADRFKAKILQELSSNTSSLGSLDDMQVRASTIFGAAPTVEQNFNKIDATALIELENHYVLKKRIIGKEDVDIATMIKKLGNSDWVKQGRSFFELNENICPFCQKKTDEKFEISLNEYFDEAFAKDSNSINELIASYNSSSSRLLLQITAMTSNTSKFLDVEKLKIERDLLESKISNNNQQLLIKKKEPSQIITLDSVLEVTEAIKKIIDSANNLINDHNKVISNLNQEKTKLTGEVWRYLLDVELKIDLASYVSKKESITKACNEITNKIVQGRKEKELKENELKKLEKETTSIQPTIDGINSLLVSFGFHSFALSKGEDERSYKLVRADKADAKETLSEGEKTFITFLYFYYLLKGSNSESGIAMDRIVVFDDPISSLDSDILFIVSSLIKALFEEIRARKSYIKQLFVFTHNVYFHKEITFDPLRKGRNPSDETFWIVRKTDSGSKIEVFVENPIKTSYDLLWAEIRRADRSSLTIQNTLRRILENYFKILGGINPETICNKFEGKERIICKSLFAWVNDGSHYALDDLFVASDGTSIDVYLKVFKEIFVRTDHLAHYEMMMG